MRKQTTETTFESRPEWDTLEHWLRVRMQNLIQQMLEEEVTEFLGRSKSVRRSDSYQSIVMTPCFPSQIHWIAERRAIRGSRLRGNDDAQLVTGVHGAVRVKWYQIGIAAIGTDTRDPGS